MQKRLTPTTKNSLQNEIEDRILFVLQPINLCNLNCSYCYLPGRRDPEKMTFSMAKQIAKKICQTNCSNQATVIWHSGEPLASGLDYFRTILGLFDEHKTDKVKIKHSVQTNATLINDSWIDLFNQYQFKVGVSVDGPAHVHDRYRVNWNNKGSHKATQRGIDCLNAHEYPFDVISVITDYSLDFANEIFDYYLSIQTKRVGLNVEDLESFNHSTSFSRINCEPNQLKKKLHGFMDQLFQLWFTHKEHIEFREFNQFIRSKISSQLMQKPISQAELVPLKIITIDRMGNLFTFSPSLSTLTEKDHKRFCVGNIMDINDFDDIYQNDNFIKMHDDILDGVEQCKINCNYFNTCGGGRPGNKFFENGSLATAETTSCQLNIQVISDVINSYLQT